MQIGQRIGAYEVIAKLGEGGMGEVYRARDTKLDRDVALKILPESFANDPDRLMRFEREAKTLASLNHPNIAAIYGIENNALVMELVEGDDLSTRIARGPIPLDEALPIARQIADALDAAHEQGIIHRDLKPANIKLRSDGMVKVLDFGLAKALDQDPQTSHLRQGYGGQARPQDLSPTITSPAMTMQGVILGTAAYMAPEQAKGKAVDRRADIWAFGCVLYEMLTGKRTFAGEDVSDMLVSVLRDDPRWSALPPDTPPSVRRLLRRCLQKDPQKRLSHIGPARLDLTEDSADEPAAAPASHRFGRIPAAIAGALAGALVVAAIGVPMMNSATTAVARPPVRFSIEPAPGTFFPGGNQVPRFAISPDGTMLVYQQQDSNASQLWIRPIEAVVARPVPGTLATGVSGGLTAQQPFWSPDGRYIAYFDEPASQVKRLNRQTGAVQTLATITGNQLAGTWNDDNVVLISSVGSRGVLRMPADGGTPVAVTTLDAATSEVAHLWPDFLPDGKHFVYLATFAGDMEPVLFIGSLDGRPPKRLFASSAMARVAWPDRLLFVRAGALVSQPFDLDRLELTGEPVVVLNDISVTDAGRVGVSASRNGVLVHSVGHSGVEIGETAWVDRSGRPIQRAPSSVDVGVGGLRLSRDGRHLIYSRAGIERNGRRLNEMWIQDTQRGIESRFSSDFAAAGVAVFSPDGSYVWFRRAGDSVAISRQPISGAVPAEAVLPLNASQQALLHDVSPDGRLLFSIAENTGGDRRLRPNNVASAGASRLALLAPSAGQTPVTYLDGTFALYGAALSPDARWLAYGVGTTVNNRQVFIQPFPDASTGKWAVSGLGGGFPRWRGDGRELYFVDANRRVMAVSMSAAKGGIDIGAPSFLFELEPLTNANPFDVSADGQRFVVLRNKGLGESPARMIVTIDWLQALNTLDAGAPR